MNRLGVYQSGTELVAASGLEYDANKGQLGIGGISNLSGVKLNIEGGVRISDKLVVGSKELNLSAYVTTSNLASVSFSGNYSDLNGRPDMALYTSKSELATTLGSYYTKVQVDGEITSKLVTFKSSEVAPLIADELGSYYTKSEVDNKVGGDLGDYTKVASGCVSSPRRVS